VWRVYERILDVKTLEDMMIITWFLPKYLIWLSWSWPFVNVRKGHRIK